MRKTGCWMGMGLLLSIAGAANAESMRLSSRVIEPPEMGPVTIQELAMDGKSFCFICPHGWNPWVDQKSRVVNFSAVGEGTIMLRHLPATNATDTLDGDFSTPEQLLQRFKGASITASGTCMTGFDRSQYYDLRYTTQPGTTIIMRVVQAQVDGVRFEIILQAMPERFASSLRLFQGFLTSFQGNHVES